MGLFSTVMHIYKRSQTDIVSELINELRSAYGFTKFNKIDINSFKEFFSNNRYSQSLTGIIYLITEQHGSWSTIVEADVNLESPLYLYELTNCLSKRLNTYTMSFHLYDGDVLYYNLDRNGEPLDGYSSNYQYFLTEAADKEEIISQRHTPQVFSEILPKTKEIDKLDKILNEGYWNAFDNNDLDADGIPNDDKYDVDEEDRFERIGKYLEIYTQDTYPFVDWHNNLSELNLSECYLLKIER